MLKSLSCIVNFINLILLAFIITAISIDKYPTKVNSKIVKNFYILKNELLKYKLIIIDNPNPIKKITIKKNLNIDKKLSKIKVLDNNLTNPKDESNLDEDEWVKERVFIEMETVGKDDIFMYKIPTTEVKPIDIHLKSGLKIMATKNPSYGWYTIEIFNNILYVQEKYLKKI